MAEKRAAIIIETLTLSISHILPSTCLINLAGEMDSLVYERAIKFILDNMGTKENYIVVDMTGLEFMDSSGIKLFMALNDLVGLKNIAVLGVNKNLKRVLSVAGLSEALTFLPDREAVRSWGKEQQQAA